MAASRSYLRLHSLVFKRYCSFDNHYDQRLVGKIRETIKACGEEDGIWDATEKVHGTHFAITAKRYSHDDDGEGFILRGAKRSGFLEWDEKFHNHQRITEKYAKQVEGALLMVQAKNPAIDRITIHGEIFGGFYPGVDGSGKTINTKSEDAIKVQNGVYYSPDNDWYVFDIHDGTKYLDTDLTTEIFKRYGFFYARPLYTGTFEEIFGSNNTFNSTIPALLGSPDHENLKENPAEGLVLKPRKTIYFPNKSRVMIKSKTFQFSERAKADKAEKKLESKKQVDDPEVEAIWDALSEYITENRLNNVKSKDPKITGKKLMGPFTEDVLDEFIRCHEDQELVKTFETMPKSRKSVVTKRLGTASLCLVNKT